MNDETVGSLLAVIANSLNDALRILMFADKRAWGPDEFEQLRLLEETLDEAKRDFQELPTMVNGRFYYEHDRKRESLEDLRELCTRFELHARTFKDWLRTGGPINPLWATETMTLRRDLHRSQCRAARRVWEQGETTMPRCLGAFQVYRVQRMPEKAQQRQLEELMACNQVGKFERFGEHDIAFVCDFCDGYIVWEDLREMPSRLVLPGEGSSGSSDPAASETAGTASANPTSATALAPATQKSWQTTGFRKTDGGEKGVVFAPVAIANHRAPDPGDWQSAILCPFCDDYYEYEQGDTEMDRIKWNQDEGGFEDLNAFQEHLAWSHATIAPSTNSCGIM